MLKDTCCGCGTDLSSKPGDAILEELDRRREIEETGEIIPIMYGLCVPCLVEMEMFIDNRDKK